MLSTSVASAYAELVHLFTVRDTAAAALALRTKTVELFRERNKFGMETLASVRQVEARQSAAEAQLLTVDELIALQKNGIAALLGAGPDRGLAIVRPTGRFAASKGLPPNLALELLGRRPDIVAARLRTEAAAKRIDQQKAGFYPSVNLMGFVGVQSLGIGNLTKSGSDFGSVGPAISLPIFNTQRLQGQLRGAHAEYDAAVAIYNATSRMPCAKWRTPRPAANPSMGNSPHRVPPWPLRPKRTTWSASATKARLPLTSMFCLPKIN